VIYDLWDSETGNIIAVFDTKAEALSVVREALSRHGEEYVESLLLGQEDSRGHTSPLAQGKDLVRLARSANSDDAASV
jgi:hypothetical protein